MVQVLAEMAVDPQRVRRLTDEQWIQEAIHQLPGGENAAFYYPRWYVPARLCAHTFTHPYANIT
ncbi:MAG: hypothetical protein HY320_06530 [Armatimonadetes bacterium]|nr:hypothetical protein [Armatimonadota bacterium]